MVLPEESRSILSLIDHGVSRTRQAEGIGRPRLRFAVPPDLPETLTVEAASPAIGGRCSRRRLGLGGAAAGRGVLLDPAVPGRCRPGLGGPGAWRLPGRLEVMHLGESEPDVWVPGGSSRGHRPDHQLRRED